MSNEQTDQTKNNIDICSVFVIALPDGQISVSIQPIANASPDGMSTRCCRSMVHMFQKYNSLSEEARKLYKEADKQVAMLEIMKNYPLKHESPLPENTEKTS